MTIVSRREKSHSWFPFRYRNRWWYLSLHGVTTYVVRPLSPIWLFCDSVDCSPPGSSVHGIWQARVLEWVASPFSSGFSQPRGRAYVSCIGRWFFTTETPGKPRHNNMGNKIDFLGFQPVSYRQKKKKKKKFMKFKNYQYKWKTLMSLCPSLSKISLGFFIMNEKGDKKDNLSGNHAEWITRS